MYALVTTHRDVIMSITVGAEVDALKAHVRDQLSHLSGPLRWTNYLSHEGAVTSDGLTSHTIHRVQEI